jgi:hypothetical protein
LDDVIERIKMKNLNGNASSSQSMEKSKPYHKGPPKWLIKTLESIHLDEVGKMRT